MKILMGTTNPGKIQGARQAFEKYFENVEIEGVKVSSEVSDQPINDEIFQGVRNRVKNVKLISFLFFLIILKFLKSLYFIKLHHTKF